MGQDYQQSGHIKHSPRLSNRLSHTCSKNLSSGRKHNFNKTRLNKTFTKRDYSPHPANNYKLLQPLFSSAKERGSFHLVIDLSPLNKIIANKQLQKENLMSLKHMFIYKGNYVVKLDLKDAYI